MTATDPDRPVGRQESRFFSQDSTKQAIVKLAQVDTLVIYCGAGVTIDRTGLTWNDLITRILWEELTSDRPDQKTDVARRIDDLGDRYTPSQMASILRQARADKKKSARNDVQELVPRLKLSLYQDNGWQEGALVRNLVRLAVSYLSLGKRVVIVTTNFDDYLETGFHEYCREMRDEYSRLGRPMPSLPHLKVMDLTTHYRSRQGRNGNGGGNELELVYLHGRLPSAGDPTGSIVLSECDYFDAREHVVKYLKNLFDTDRAGVLVLGSGGNDEPLLASLAMTKSGNCRYVLFPVLSTGMVRADEKDFPALLEYVRARWRHLGTTCLVPDFYYQVAQFCEEILTCVGLATGPQSYLDTPQNVRYGLRLVSWWERWTGSTYGTDAAALNSRLASALAEIQELLYAGRAHEHRNRTKELLKLEVWVRNNPRRLRQLCRWGTSSAIVTDHDVLRWKPLSLGSGHASVRAFIEGRPQLVSRETLADERIGDSGQPELSRWTTFLSIPIRVDYSTVGDPAVLVGIPVGVVTLASMATIEDSGIPNNANEAMANLVKLLLSLGLEILRA